MQNSNKKNKAVGAVEAEDKSSFRYVFEQVVECINRHNISDKAFFDSFPKDIRVAYPYPSFKSEYDDAVVGIFPEGVMSEKVAEGVLAVVKLYNETVTPLRHSLAQRATKSEEQKERGLVKARARSMAGIEKTISDARKGASNPLFMLFSGAVDRAQEQSGSPDVPDAGPDNKTLPPKLTPEA